MGENDEYDVDERAAIREIEGGQEKDAAGKIAKQEVEKRNTKQQIQLLREKRDKVGAQMRAEEDPEKKRKLFDKWMALSSEIIESGKEAK